MDYSYYDKLIKKDTRLKYDVTPLFNHPEAFSNLINDIEKLFNNCKFDVITGLDAVGFIIGGALAHKLKIRFVPVRKEGRLPGYKESLIRESFIDYSQNKKAFEMNKGEIKKEDQVLIVDDWMETGGQMKAAIKLIEKQGGKIIGLGLLGAENNNKTEILFKKYNCKAIKVFHSN